MPFATRFRSSLGFWSLLRDPVSAEKRGLLAQRWDGLDDAVKLPGQGPAAAPRRPWEIELAAGGGREAGEPL